jgi:hypothetical protein
MNFSAFLNFMPSASRQGPGHCKSTNSCNTRGHGRRLHHLGTTILTRSDQIGIEACSANPEATARCGDGWRVGLHVLVNGVWKETRRGREDRSLAEGDGSRAKENEVGQLCNTIYEGTKLWYNNWDGTMRAIGDGARDAEDGASWRWSLRCRWIFRELSWSFGRRGRLALPWGSTHGLRGYGVLCTVYCDAEPRTAAHSSASRRLCLLFSTLLSFGISAKVASNVSRVR